MKKTPSTIKSEAKTLEGVYHPIKDWVMDPKGYFLIRINRKKHLLEIGLCKKNNEVELIIEGKTPQDVYFTACKEGALSRLDHAAYLGKELQKAFTALELGIEYVQDSPLDLRKK